MVLGCWRCWGVGVLEVLEVLGFNVMIELKLK